MQIKDIELNKIKVIANIRLDEDDREIPQLMESIKQHSLLEPIGVQKERDGYVLVFGYRRYLACKKLLWKTIPAIIATDGEKTDLLILNAVENLQRRDISATETGAVCEELLKRDLTEEEIAVVLSKPIDQIKHLIQIYHEIPASVRKRIKIFRAGRSSRKGMLPISLVYKVMQLRKIGRLKEVDLIKLLNYVRKEGFVGADIMVISLLMQGGLQLEEALKERKKYMVMTLHCIVKKKELEELRKKYHPLSDSNILKMILYGAIEQRLSCPSIIKKKFVEYADEEMEKE